MRSKDLDITRVQDAGLSGADDPTVLAWAAEEGRILLSHDVATITRYAYKRLARDEMMPGVVEIPLSIAVGSVIDDLMLLIECSVEGEWAGQVLYLPLR